jgi:GTP-binding protein
LLKVLDARFVTSAVDADGIPRDGIPHVAFVGRSNVGKSTLLNALLKRDLARTSAAAGKTRLANLYKVSVDGGPGGPGQPGGAGQWSVYFADLPGYGYARGGRDSVTELRKIAEAYFGGGHPIAGVLHLVDARHPGIESDLDAARWLQSLAQSGLARTTIATKIDKLSRAERVKNLRELERQLGMAALPLSAASGEGLDDLWTLIARLSRR